MVSGRDKLVVLDAVRGLSAFYVVGYHTVVFLTPHRADLLQFGGAFALLASGSPLGLFGFGHYAVVVFFVLSGFVIHLGQGKHPERHRLDLRGWLRGYAWRRVARIYPPLVAAIALTVAVDRLGPRLFPAFAYDNPQAVPLRVGDVARLLLPLDRAGCGADSSLWSLQYELLFYVGYVGLLRLVNGRHVGCWVAALAAPGLWLGAVQPHPSLLVSALVVYLPIWAAGMVLADWWARGRTLRHPLPVAATGIGLLIVTAGVANNDWPVFDYSWALGVALLLAALVLRPSPLPAGRLTGLAGRTALPSYSIYLAHAPALLVVRAALGPGDAPWLLLTGAAAGIATGLALWWLIERPAVRLAQGTPWAWPESWSVRWRRSTPSAAGD